jgi:hypothetical protein
MSTQELTEAIMQSQSVVMKEREHIINHLYFIIGMLIDEPSKEVIKPTG